MYSDVLIPTDGSKGIEGAITHGLALAERYDATVHALSVVDLGVFEEIDTDVSFLQSVRESRTAAAHRATAAVQSQASDYNVTVVDAVREGDPAHEIVSYADEHADLIAMGTHGRTGLGQYLLGSVTTSIVRTAAVPVLTNRLTDPPRSTAYTDILIATDGTAGSAAAIEHAIALARRYEATLHALYVVDTKLDQNLPVQNVLEQDGQRAVSAVTTAAESDGVSTTKQVVPGIPHEEIRSTIEERDIDLLVLGTHGRKGLDRFVLGSVAERLIRVADIPVLTVRSTDAAGE
ncbi:universal stress protein [Halocatena pleomorpha]|uniref:Universal stress protein n=1 Tax=Halocatena pleomorpha TaxID=1785090 RepID=A0A3P3RJI9_9EURY|nr:universal stress protein [Halocatena pleomorpha]RRJ33671.1 universal stress protein [Halocatena pleomorpha]